MEGYNMKDLSKEVTVFVITTSRSCNYDECIEALKHQTVKVDIIVIKDFHPMSKAFQKMIDRCMTPYYVQVDDDMILYPNAIETMYEEIIKTDKKTSMISFWLNDVHLKFHIHGVKIYKHNVFKKYPYNFECLSCEVEQTSRMERDGYKVLLNESQALGDHSPRWTNDGIFERYFNLMEKYKKFEYGWMKNLPNRLWEIFKINPSKQNLYAILGAYTSIIKEGIENKEKDYTEGKKQEFSKAKIYFENKDQKLNVVKLIDQWGWSYYYIGIEQQRYSKHNIILQKFDAANLDNVDVLYLHGPDMCPAVTDDLIKTCRIKGISIIGGYGGLVGATYPDADVIATISPQTYDFGKKNYTQPVVFLPESIDTEYFKSDIPFDKNRFNVGYAGSPIPLKRIYLFDKLKFPVIKKCEWGKQFWVAKNQEHMKNFYQGIDVLILLSTTECMPRVVLEAMAMGLPVVATNVGSLSFVLDKEWIVDRMPDDEVVRQTNEKLTYLMKHPNKRREVGERNREYVEKYFSWKVTQPLWDDFFEKVYLGNKQALINFPNYMDNFKQ